MRQQPKFLQKKWRHDPRSLQFSHHRFFGSVSPVQLPATLGKILQNPLDQGNTQRCGAYGSVENGWYINLRDFSPDWQAYTIGRIQGHSIDFEGSDPNAVMKSMRDYGFLLKELSPFSLEKDGIQGSGFSAKWPDLDDKAKEFASISAFLRVDGTNDTFDNIRNALMLAYDPVSKKGACVDVFSAWYDNWTFSEYLGQPNNLVGWHRTLFVDWTEENGVPYLIMQNSYGKLVGNNGFHKVPREVVNMEFSLPNRSLKICKVLTPEQIALAKQETPLGKIQRAIINVWYTLSTMFG